MEISRDITGILAYHLTHLLSWTYAKNLKRTQANDQNDRRNWRMRMKPVALEKEIDMPAPTMTDEQRAAALEKARVVRAARSEITTKLSAKIMTPGEALDMAGDPVVGRMKVKSFLNALPGYGKVKTEKLMEELGIPETRRIQGLGSKQMENLRKALEA